jgi:hypothetical protein
MKTTYSTYVSRSNGYTKKSQSSDGGVKNIPTTRTGLRNTKKSQKYLRRSDWKALEKVPVALWDQAQAALLPTTLIPLSRTGNGQLTS